RDAGRGGQPAAAPARRGDLRGHRFRRTTRSQAGQPARADRCACGGARRARAGNPHRTSLRRTATGAEYLPGHTRNAAAGTGHHRPCAHRPAAGGGAAAQPGGAGAAGLSGTAGMSLLRRERNVLPGFGLTLGFTSFFLCAIVLLPLTALVMKGAGMDLARFLAVVTDARAVASYRLSFGSALIAASINLVFGFIVAWVLVRYRFPGRRIVDAIIDMPFALPTAVSGIALTAVFAGNGWIGQYLEPLGIQVAYTQLGTTLARPLIGMPFVVRAIQPALQELPKDVEEVAATLGASPLYTFRRVILPALLPAVLTGFALAFARGVGEYGSVIFIAGNIPMQTEITPLLIVIRLEEYDYAAAAALGCVMLAISFLMLLAINLLQQWGRKRAHRVRA